MIFFFNSGKLVYATVKSSLFGFVRVNFETNYLIIRHSFGEIASATR